MSFIFNLPFRTIAIDLRGFGSSDGPKGISNYKISKMVEDLRAFLEYLSMWNLDYLSFIVNFRWIIGVNLSDRLHCILICHDIGATIGWEFVSKYRSMVEKYIFMGCPSYQLHSQLFQSSMDQFSRTWYIIFFQMPIIPETLMSTDDFASFSVIWNTQVSQNFTEEYQEAYRHKFSQPGAHYSHNVLLFF